MNSSSLALPAPSVTVEVVDATLRDLARARTQHDHVLLEWLLRGDELQVDRVCGFASMREYGERVFGFGGRGVEDRLRVARAIRELPRLKERFAAGDIVYSVVRELCRVAIPETEAEWLASVAGKTATEVQRAVAAHAPGDRPTDPQKPQLSTRRVTLELSPDAYALLENARAKATNAAGGHVDDSAFIAEAMLAFLSGGGERDAGRAAFQIALTRDAHGGAVIEAAGQAVDVDAVTVEMAECDAEHIGDVGTEGEAARASQTIPPKTRRQVVRRHQGCCAVPGCRNAAFVHIHHVEARSEGGTHDPEKLVVLCSAHHRAAHDGALDVRGTFTSGFEFRHADGRAYGSPLLDARRAAVMRDSFEVLRGMGWKEREVKSMLDAVHSELGVDPVVEWTPPEVVRLALRSAAVSCMREEEVLYQRCG